jgi:hypothetical protein
MVRWLRERPLPLRVFAYVALAASVFALSAGVGAVGALMWRGDLSFPEAQEPMPPEEQETTRIQREDTAPQEGEDEYAGKVGDVQARSVDAFLDSHEKLLRYDALTAEDVEQMRGNQATLQEAAEQVDLLDPPANYEEHHRVFLSAVDEMHEASRLAYGLAADPTSATQAAFDEYDGHVDIAADRLRRSNEILGREYKAIGGVREVSPL